jgi:hypothetical protein
MKSLHEIRQMLGAQIAGRMNTIQADLISFNASGETYRILEYDEHFCAVLRRSVKPEAQSHIGFPFPIYSYDLPELIGTSATVGVHLRGRPVRDFQRNALFDSLQSRGAVVFNTALSRAAFRDAIENLCLRYDQCHYFDPYSFIGDSFIGLHFQTGVTAHYNLALSHIYSDSHSHMRVVAPASTYDPYQLTSFRGLAIMPDLLDVHWERTVTAIHAIAVPGNTALVLGRNLAIHFQKDATLVYHTNEDDPLLRNSNIEDYMNLCLAPFADPIAMRTFAVPSAMSNFVINPFGSIGSKTFPFQVALDLVTALAERYNDSRFLMIAGLRSLPLHMSWLARFRASIADRGLAGRVAIRYYDSFMELRDDLERYQIGFGITADTSIAHFFNFIGLRNITLYNIDRCDIKSCQSLSSDSPLGFCRFDPLQFPLLFSAEHAPSVASMCALIDAPMNLNVLAATEPFGQAVDSCDFVRPTEDHQRLLEEHGRLLQQPTLGWLLDVYDPNVLVSNLSDDAAALMRANWRITPAYKLSQLAKRARPAVDARSSK